MKISLKKYDLKEKVKDRDGRFIAVETYKTAVMIHTNTGWRWLDAKAITRLTASLKRALKHLRKTRDKHGCARKSIEWTP